MSRLPSRRFLVVALATLAAPARADPVLVSSVAGTLLGNSAREAGPLLPLAMPARAGPRPLPVALVAAPGHFDLPHFGTIVAGRVAEPDPATLLVPRLLAPVPPLIVATAALAETREIPPPAPISFSVRPLVSSLLAATRRDATLRVGASGLTADDLRVLDALARAAATNGLIRVQLLAGAGGDGVAARARAVAQLELVRQYLGGFAIDPSRIVARARVGPSPSPELLTVDLLR